MAKLRPAKQLPASASYSQLTTAARCGFRYWLAYMAGLEPATKSMGLIRGTLLHEAYDRYMFTGRQDHAVAYQVLEDQAQKAVNEGADPVVVDQVLEEAQLVLDHYLPWADENDDWELILPLEGQQQCETDGEYVLTLPDGTPWPFYFKIDAHIRVDGAHFMLENKFRKNLDANGLEHDLQILLYQSAWNALHPDDRIEGVLYNIVAAKPRKKDNVIAVREHYYRGPQEERVGLRIAAAMIQNLRVQAATDLWPMNPRKECSWDCDFVGLCLAVRAGGTVAEHLDMGTYRISERSEQRQRAEANAES